MNKQQVKEQMQALIEQLFQAAENIADAADIASNVQEANVEEHTFTRTLYANIYHGKRDVIRTLFPTAEKAREATTTADIVAMPVEVTVKYKL